MPGAVSTPEETSTALAPVRARVEAMARRTGRRLKILVGLSILSGSHLKLVEEVMMQMRQAGIGDIPVVVGGIIPAADAKQLLACGVARVYTPKDFAIARIMDDIVDIAASAESQAA